MGLMSMIKKKSAKKQIKEAKSSVKNALKDELKNQIKKEEKKGISEKKAQLAITGKLQVERPIATQKEEKVKDSAPAKRVSTGIPGLDEITEGGFKKSTVNLIGGGAGSGKTIFCMQFIIKGIEDHDEPGVYITFEENSEKLIEDFGRFNFDIKKKIAEKKLVILYYSPEQVERVVLGGGGTIREVIESIKAKRLVVDSLTAFTLLFSEELEKRKAVLELFDALQKWGVTTLLTSEQEPDPDKHKSTLMEFEVDSVILLYNVRKGDIRERSLEVFKMRSTKHAAKIFPMSIGNNGIIIFPEETVF